MKSNRSSIVKRHCPFCNIEGQYWNNARDLNRRLSSESFEYYLCPHCHCIFLSPIPINLSDYYRESDYYKLPETIQQIELEAQSQQERVELVKRFVPSGRLLDIGPAYGLFLYQARKLGFDVEGLEMERRCAEYLTARLDMAAVCSDSPQTALKDMGPYDVITLWHSLEHLSDPMTTIQIAAERLSRNGILVISMPNPQAFQFKILRTYWAHLDTPRHLQLIPVISLSRLLAGIGLEQVTLTSSDAIGRYCNIFGWRRSLANTVRSPRAKWLMANLGRVFEKIFDPLERLDLKGSTFTVIYKKT